jgi:hypothetical protein
VEPPLRLRSRIVGRRDADGVITRAFCETFRRISSVVARLENTLLNLWLAIKTTPGHDLLRRAMNRLLKNSPARPLDLLDPTPERDDQHRQIAARQSPFDGP